MPDTITAREVNHQFARLLREVQAGREFVVTRNGIPIARISPERAAIGSRRLTPAQERALAESLTWLRCGWPWASADSSMPRCTAIRARGAGSLDDRAALQSRQQSPGQCRRRTRSCAAGKRHRHHRRGGTARLRAVPQALAEFFHAATREGIVPRPPAARQVEACMAVFPLAPGPTASALRTALAEASAGRFQFYDALLLATARDGSRTAVITGDMGSHTGLDGAHIVPPLGPGGGVSEAALL